MATVSKDIDARLQKRAERSRGKPATAPVLSPKPAISFSLGIGEIGAVMNRALADLLIGDKRSVWRGLWKRIEAVLLAGEMHREVVIDLSTAECAAIAQRCHAEQMSGTVGGTFTILWQRIQMAL